MAGLRRTIRSVLDYRKVMADAMSHRPFPRGTMQNRLDAVANFGPNPGKLGMLRYVPERLAANPALLVVLHGCTQTAEGYDYGAGWSTLAREHGFALLYPEQRRSNNQNVCFNWFDPRHTERGRGEAASIRQMIAHMVTTHHIDPGRIFITGLSAGGAMASAMLALYPEVFSAGAIIAGLPYRAANNVQQAFQSMSQGPRQSSRQAADVIRSASQGPWPRISVWHGDGDKIVSPRNGEAIVEQWADVHGARMTISTTRGAQTEKIWRDSAGRDVVQHVTIAGLGHGTPIAAGAGPSQCGVAGPFLLDVGISSTHQIADFFGVLADKGFRKPSDDVSAADRAQNAQPINSEEKALDGDIVPPIRGVDVRGVIDRALRAAGLIR